MVTWQEIGRDNFRAARDLYDVGQYRSSASRSYYAAFSVVTHELNAAGARFGGPQETPTHQAVPKLMKQYLTLPGRQMITSIAIIRRLYAARIAADYQRRSTDGVAALDALRDAAAFFRYLGVDDE